MSKSFRFLTPITGPKTKSSGLSVTSELSQVHLDQLDCPEEQLNEIRELYRFDKALHRMFVANSEESQLDAHTMLAQHGLGLNTVADLESRWNIKWKKEWGNGPTCRIRVLMQCYDEKRRQVREMKKRQNSPSKSHRRNTTADDLVSKTNPPVVPWKRLVPYNFTGCLAHAEITYQNADNVILRIAGYLVHNEACLTSTLERYPRIPLHPHVYLVALKQLQQGADLISIKQTNQQYIDTKFYRDCDNPEVSKNFRYLILPSDTSNLYRQHARSQGIAMENKAEYNVDSWLNPQSSNFKPELHRAVLHYAPRTTKSERFEITIATKEMQEATWKYGHKCQIILDGTFGVSDCRLLLFIVMGVDEDKHGVPLAFFLFSAPAGNQLSSSGYDSAILKKLLQKWKERLEKDGGQEFRPSVVITDTDLKERRALVEVFPTIVLLLCKFHLRQCWTNKMKALKLTSQNGKGSFEAKRVISRLYTLQLQLIESSSFPYAQDLVQTETHLMEGFQTHNVWARKAVDFLKYLWETWMSEPIWQSWSKAGKIKAAGVLQAPVEGVLLTTNHLESFNRILKHDHIRSLQNGGKRLRFDVLVLYLITRILPAIFSSRRHIRQYKDWRANRFPTLSTKSMHKSDEDPGVDNASGPQANPHASLTKASCVAWLPGGNTASSSSRMATAEELIKRNLLVELKYDTGSDVLTLKAKCLSSKSLPTEQAPIAYDVQICIDGHAHCSCPDFHHRSLQVGACKHICALLLSTQQAREGKNNPNGVFVPPFWLPNNVDAALQLQRRVEQHTQDPIASSPNTVARQSVEGGSVMTNNIDIAEEDSVVEGVGRITSELMDMLECLEIPREFNEEKGSKSPGITDATHDKDLVFLDSSSRSGLNTEETLVHGRSNCSQEIQEQIRIHINHFTQKLLPELHHYKSLLDEWDGNPSPELLEVSQLLLSIHGRIGAARSTDEPTFVSQKPQASATPKTPPRASTLRAYTLLPPSPEKRQVRHQSHSVL
ncbi:hypothetical protein FRC03_008953 [Tulasnella sp. 419]|nr:hypothetical protein FRC03_008953 [Tulasnella sp. 419]